MTAADGILSVRVEGARKRDAGRGIARLPTSVQRELGVLSGDPIIVEGDRLTVVKVWPAGDDGTVIQIDGDTRATIGANIGDMVEIRKASVEPARAVTLNPTDDHSDLRPNEGAVKRQLVDRLVREGKRIRIEGYGAFVVSETSPEGSVRITDRTTVTVDPSLEATQTERTGGTGESLEEHRPTGATYEDIGGLDEELDLVREMVELPLAEPELFTRLGISPPKGVLLHGPPGTGKTLIARAVANEVDAYFDTISGPEIVSKYKGESEERLREAFEQAAENAPAILFVDEIDSIAGARDEDADMENRVVAQLLTLMDGLEDREEVIVIGATNRVDTVDPALRRGGRFDREIEIGVPTAAGRREILDVHTREMPLGEGVDLDELAARTHGFVGADIESLTREAGMAALRDLDRDQRDETMGQAESTDSAGEESSKLPELVVSRAHLEEALAAVEPSAMREYVAETPSTTFADVGGLEAVKERLREAVEWPLSYAPLFDAAATTPPSGVLLHGPPGTGKTLLAEAIAGESGVNFLRVAGPELLDRYVGETEAAIRDLFERARQTAPAIVFLDEIDAIAHTRGQGHEVLERVVSQLLTEMDRAGAHPSLVVIAATNRRDVLDPALLRPGRLEQHIEVPNPDESARQAILEVHTRETPLGADVDLAGVATDTAGYSGAELASLVREASMKAIREVATAVDPDEAAAHRDEVVVERDHFMAAKATIDDQR